MAPSDRPPAARSERRLRPLLGLLPFLAPYRGRLALALAALLVAAAATLGLPVAVRMVIDQGFGAASAEAVDRHFVALFALTAVLALAAACRYYLVMWLGERVVADVRAALYRHVIRMSPTFFEVTRTGEVLSRLNTDTTLVQSVAGVNLSVALRSALTLLGALVMLFATSPRLTALILVLVPAVLAPLLVFGRRVRRLSRDTQDRVADSSAVASETLNAIQTIQAFTLEDHQAHRYGASVASSFETAVRRIRARAWLTALAICVVFGAVVLVLRIGAHAVLAGTMSAGELGQFLLYAILVAGSAASLSEMWGEVQRAAGALERIGELLAMHPEIVAPERPVALPEPAVGSVSFEEVTFEYPSRPGDAALDRFSLAVAAGETVALVGPSGAGKSTVFQLLLRFYDPARGRVLVDGVDVALARPEAVRERIAIVPQDVVVFAADALENIRSGRPEASDEEVRAAALAAGADDFVRALPQGYHTWLGERGVRLSGGQRQRLAIARAILKRPAVMLLDEATSALDAESERLVQDALAQLRGRTTTLVIAHRLATVLEADRIVVMDRGRVVAAGTHASLLDGGGLYARLAALQFADGAGPTRAASGL